MQVYSWIPNCTMKATQVTIYYKLKLHNHLMVVIFINWKPCFFLITHWFIDWLQWRVTSEITAGIQLLWYEVIQGSCWAMGVNHMSTSTAFLWCVTIGLYAKLRQKKTTYVISFVAVAEQLRPQTSIAEVPGHTLCSMLAKSREKFQWSGQTGHTGSYTHVVRPGGNSYYVNFLPSW